MNKQKLKGHLLLTPIYLLVLFCVGILLYAFVQEPTTLLLIPGMVAFLLIVEGGKRGLAILEKEKEKEKKKNGKTKKPTKKKAKKKTKKKSTKKRRSNKS